MNESEDQLSWNEPFLNDFKLFNGVYSEIILHDYILIRLFSFLPCFDEALVTSEACPEHASLLNGFISFLFDIYISNLLCGLVESSTEPRTYLSQTNRMNFSRMDIKANIAITT